jgi:glutamate formiminotransferase/glutamate formiminotransferase/formiminotetrahydrofolate cyclodeaminase
MTPPILFAVPNVSEGRDAHAITAIGEAFLAARGRRADSVRLLDVHSDADHHRSVFTLAGAQGGLADALLAGARAAVESIDVVARASAASDVRGEHPHVGAVDVVPLVYLDAHARGAACAEALVVADRIGCELDVPVFLYGELTGDEQATTRAQLRRGGVAGLAERIGQAGETRDGSRPDFGPARMHASAGATLVAAREPLVAFNVQLQAPASLLDARAIAAVIREGGAEGIVGLRAIGVELGGGVAQVSMNVERPLEVPLASVVEAVAKHSRPASGELVGLAPRAAFEGFPEDLPMPGFDPARHVIENALGS